MSDPYEGMPFTSEDCAVVARDVRTLPAVLAFKCSQNDVHLMVYCLLKQASRARSPNSGMQVWFEPGDCHEAARTWHRESGMELAVAVTFMKWAQAKWYLHCAEVQNAARQRAREPRLTVDDVIAGHFTPSDFLPPTPEAAEMHALALAQVVIEEEIEKVGDKLVELTVERRRIRARLAELRRASQGGAQ